MCSEGKYELPRASGQEKGRKSLANKGLLKILPGNGVGNGITTSPATEWSISEWKLHLAQFFLGQFLKTVQRI